MKKVNRELKFRVWDNVDYMSSPFTLKDIQNDRIKFTSECTVMQYTGLTDKNGKEIYEGDILPMKFDHPQTEGVKYGNEFTLNGVVEYDLPHQAKYKISFPDNKHDIISCEFGWGSMPDLEVIGNIHENPELIEQNK